MNKLKTQLANKKDLFKNTKQIQCYNIKTANILMVSVFVGLFVVYTFSSINNITSAAASAYLITDIILIAIFIFSKKFMNPKYHLVLAYGVMIVFYALLIYLDVFINPSEQSSAFIGGIAVLPMVFIDKTWRVTLVTLGVILTSMILSFYFKFPSHIVIDAINSFAFALGGIIFGSSMNLMRLKSFEMENMLLEQRDVDYLTGLRNRRKMFELFAKIDQNEIPRPSCAMMIDIDHFKQYNDKYGHAVGDEFLRCFGKTLLSIEKVYNLKFYRYGGEEISAFMWGYDDEQQAEIAEFIRAAVENMEIEHGRTISSGYVNCIKLPHINMEDALILADSALYQAKNTGRNRAMLYGSLYTA